MKDSEEQRAEWQRLVDEQHASGMSVAGWCRSRDLSLNTFHYRRKRLASPTDLPVSLRNHCISESAPQRPACGAEWVSLTVAEPKEGALTLRVGRVAIDVPPGFDRRLLLDVLSILEARC